MQNVALIPNQYRDPDLSATRQVARRIQSYGKTVLLDGVFAAHMGEGYVYAPQEENIAGADLVVVLGGDGTILRIAPIAARSGVPIAGINFGNLGFLSQAEKGDNRIFEDLFSGNYTVRRNMMLEAQVVKKGEKAAEYLALNDIVVSHLDYSRVVHLDLRVDGERVDAYYADGSIIATPTGSTAYSLSAGGPILHPDMEAIVVTPVCPHTLKARCMVLPADKTVAVSICPPHRVDAVLTVDGKKAQVLEEGDYVRVTKSAFYTSLVQLPERSFFGVLRKKLSERDDF